MTTLPQAAPTSVDSARPKTPPSPSPRVWRPALRAGIFVLVIAAAAGVGWRYLHSRSAPPVRFTTAAADHGPLAAKVTASGTLSAIVTVQVGSQVSGRIEAWYADFSTKVKRGRLIARIEPSLLTANVTFVFATRADVVRIPNAALRFKPDAATVAAMTGGGATLPGHDELAADQRIVWVAALGRASPRVVRIGISDGMQTEVVEGEVRPGDAVVSEAVAPGPAAKKGP